MTSGTCEMCKAWSAHLVLRQVRMGERVGNHTNFITSRFYSAPIHVCHTCNTRNHSSWQIPSATVYISQKEPHVLLENQKFVDAASAFMSFTKRSPLVQDVFYLPDESVPAQYRGKLNIMLGLNNYSDMGYHLWSFSHNKCLLDAWEKPEERKRFLGTAGNRFVISLGRVTSLCSDLHVWLRVCGRVSHIDHYIRRGCIGPEWQIVPHKIVRLASG